MTNIEMDVARSQIRANKAVANHFEETDWGQRRYEIAKEMMPSCLDMVRDFLNNGQPLGEEYNGMTASEVVAVVSLQYADALIAELKKKGE